ncbi:HlyD family efflux transporter periplasmic adaptor subunit [Lysobacter sp. TY2-98]|uniref:efflux RND transporter periplasmic adaptor subunit n=1 Tax=Lysobacter sp. TY2-98 TaxID=2290922 RepID=UPI000E1FF8F5|nr:HlyD family efflux transporter periplasmic adaptor subunit [Lysobacter sp. TY2-98]AXK73237.1 HlyD family efflux transporter periplasmic adaptor subunit [Lysobacter sp. TY2-98]
MKRLWILGGLAVLGLVIAAVAVFTTGRTSTPPAPAAAVPAPPFPAFVVGSGITETGRGNVAIATNVTGVVREVDVQVGDRVAAGAPLFAIDDRDARAKLATARASVQEARARLAQPLHRLGYLERLDAAGRQLISRDSVTAARDDVAAARATLAAAEAGERQALTDLDLLVVHAPRAGRVLQVNARVGQYADNAGATPPVLMGDDDRLYLRVNVDESDAWRVKPGAPAVAMVRGEPRLRIPLKFEYVEPYVTPKPVLTGQGTERPDLRVLQLVYSFPRGDLPVYLGQQMDAYIETSRAPR